MLGANRPRRTRGYLIGDIRQILERFGFRRHEMPRASHVVFIHPNGLTFAGIDADAFDRIFKQATAG